jgi:hypothetical protein
MIRSGHDETTCYFIGPEVEHTPAFSKRTLFVIGTQDVAQIERMAKEHRVTHIFMGANHSFTCGNLDPYWDKTITALLDKGFWVTLDYQAHEHVDVLKMLNPGIWQSRIFVPLLSVRIPNVQTSSVNLTIKIDDIDFNATNEGVWCLNHHEVTDSNRFTPWQDYVSDQTVASLAGAVPNPVLRIPVPDTKLKVAVPEPVYADINKPELNMDAVKNLIDAGLDPATPSMLKADLEEKEVPEISSIKSPDDAAEAYAAGATEDPLSGKDATKVKKGKK